jgi:hypothetical protein
MPRLPQWLRRTLVSFVGAMALHAVGGSGVAFAAGNANAKLMLQALAPTTKNMCYRAALRPSDCTGYNTGYQLPLYPTLYFAYALVVDGSLTEGVSGASFGIDYDGALQSGVDIWTWQLCADAESPDAGWPGAGTGNVLTFNAATNCQTTGNANIGAVAVLGYFYCGSYTPDLFRVTPHPDSGVGTVLNCAGAVDTVHQEENDSCTHFGTLGFGPGRNGNNPCEDGTRHTYCPPIPVQPSTWGQVKALLPIDPHMRANGGDRP